jgi:hypothetical protein
MVGILHPGQQVRVNLAGLQVVSVDPPKYLVRLLFFPRMDEVEVPEGRIVAK